MVRCVRLRFTTFAIAILFSFACFAQETTPGKLAKLVLELEAHTQWAAVTEAWKTSRGSWEANIQKTPATVAQGLLQFENNLVPAGMEPAWAGRKANWRKACSDAGQQYEKLVPLLLELESNLLWASVTDVWATRRDGWIKECNNLLSAAPPAKTTPPTAPGPSVPNPALPAYCTELQKIIADINTLGLNKWASTGKTASLWGSTSKPLKLPLGTYPSVTFIIATQTGTKGNILQTTYEKFKQQLTTCLQGYTLLSTTLYNDLVNGNNETWQKDGQRISLLFSIDSDPNGDHYLYLHFFEKKK